MISCKLRRRDSAHKAYSSKQITVAVELFILLFGFPRKCYMLIPVVKLYSWILPMVNLTPSRLPNLSWTYLRFDLDRSLMQPGICEQKIDQLHKRASR